MREDEILKLSSTLRQLIDIEMKKNGLRMSKKISSGGLFSNSTYDIRKVFSLKELREISRQGFGIDENVGLFIFNAIYTN